MKSNMEQVSIKYGALTAAGLTAVFLLAKFAGLADLLVLRLLNLPILVGGVLMAIHHFKAQKNSNMAYLEGFGIGMFTSLIGVITFAVFMLFYLTLIDPAFMDVIREKSMFGSYLNPFIASFTIVIEGLGSGLMITFTLMQYFKNPYRVEV